MNGVQHDYYYVDGVLMYEKVGSEYEMFYRYDTEGRLSMVTCRDMTTGQKYYYNVVTNAQGDVVNLLGGSGAVRVTYTYDAYGRLVSMTDSTETDPVTSEPGIAIGSKNSIRYRGYVYDSETEMYYLQSRYYDPETGRFINCDAPDYIGLGDTFTSWNGFAYCENDPVNDSDPSGYKSYSGIIGFGFQVVATANVFMHQGFIGLEAIWFTKENNFGNGMIPWFYWFLGGSMGTTLDFSKLVSPELFTNPKNIIKGFGFSFSFDVSISIFTVTGNNFSSPADYLEWFTFSNITAAGVTISKAWAKKATTYGIGVSWSIGTKKTKFSLGKLWFGFSTGCSYYRSIKIGKNARELYKYVSARKPR